MEIAQQISRSGRRAWLLVVLPLIAAAAAFAVQSRAAPTWSGSATVLAPPATTQRTGAQYIADFAAALASTTVADATAKQLGQPADRIRDGLSVSPTAAGSTLLEVSWSGPSREAAQKAPTTAAGAAYTLLVRPRLNALEAQQARLDERYEKAQKTRAAYTKKIGVQLPPQDYQAVLQQSTQLKGEYQKARAEGEDDTAAALAEQVGRTAKTIRTLAPQVLEYDQLSSAVDSSYAQLSRVRDDLAEVQGALDAITAPGTITANAVSAASSRPALVRNVVGAALAGFGVALMLLLGWARLFGPPAGGPRDTPLPATAPTTTPTTLR